MSRVEECHDNHLIKANPPVEGYTQIVKRGEMGLKHLEFGILRLESGEWSGDTGKCEQALDIYSGAISIETSSGNYQHLGKRAGVFDGPPTVVYLPPKTSYRIRVEDGPVEIGIFSAVAPDSQGKAQVVADITKASIGRDNWRRDVYGILETDAPAAKLILGETLVPPGNWACVPPHKHDAFNPPAEAPYDEIWHLKVNPPQGFGIVRIYTGPNDPGPMEEIYVVEDGDTVAIPRGYHLFGAGPGYAVNCTYALAGEVRIPGAVSHDPRHAWVEE